MNPSFTAMRALLLLAILLPAATAQTVYTSAVGPVTQVWEWNDPSSWLPVGVPGPSDIAIVRSRVELENDVTVARLELRDGSLLGAGSLTVTESGEWTGGDLESNPVDDAALLVPAGVTFRVRDGSEKRFRGRDLLIDGQLDWMGRDTVLVVQTSDVHVHSGGEWWSREGRIGHLAGSLFVRIDGTFRLSDDGVTHLDHDLGSFIVDGTLRIENHTLILGNATSAFTSGGTGTIDIEDGSLWVERGAYDFSDTHLIGNDLGSVEASGGRVTLGTASFPGLVEARGGELYFGQPPGVTEIAVAILQRGALGGLIAGAGVRITDEFLWWGGRIERFATIEIPPDAKFRITSPMGAPGVREFGGGTLLNHGHVIWDTEDDVATTFTHEILNLGRIELRTDADLVRTAGFTRVVNDGLFIKTGPGEVRWDTEFGGFLNRGSVDVYSGTLVVEQSPENGPNIGEADSGAWRSNGLDTEIELLRRRRFGAGSTLAGFGRVDLTGLDTGSVYDVTVSPGIDDGDAGIGRVATLSVVGDLPMLGTDGGLRIDLQALAVSPNDVVAVEGTATLGGTLQVRLVHGFVPDVGDRFRFLTAPGGVTGNVTRVDIPDGFAAIVETDATGADLVITASTPAEAAPEVALVLEARPNPSRGSLHLAYALPEAGEVALRVYDALAREVAVLAKGPHTSGEHEAALDGLATGVYVAVLTTGEERSVLRFTVLR